MPKHSEQRRLPYTPEQMFDLVANVREYPKFLPWVAALRVKRESDTDIVAEMIVGFSALRERFTTEVNLDRPRAIHVDYIDGPLDYLKNDWRFSPDGQGGCLIDFCVDFAFKTSLFNSIAGQMFGMALQRMIDAFEKRAHALYGAGVSTGAGS